MKRALITGSFDPPTKGHFDLISRTAKIFDQVVVCICVNSEKRYMFSLEKRREMLSAMCTGLDNVRTDVHDGLVAYYARDNQIDVIVKGARNGSDFEYETILSAVNMSMAPVETLVMPTKAELSHVSSRVARDMIMHSGNVCDYLTPEVIKLI